MYDLALESEPEFCPTSSYLIVVNNLLWALLMAQWVKNLPVTQEIQESWVPSLGQEDP